MKEKCNCLDMLFENIEKIVHIEETDLVKVDLIFDNGNVVTIRRKKEDGDDR